MIFLKLAVASLLVCFYASLSLAEQGVPVTVPGTVEGVISTLFLLHQELAPTLNVSPVDPAFETELATDVTGAPDLLRSGRSLFYLIERGSKIGVRVKDPEAARRREFAGLE